MLDIVEKVAKKLQSVNTIVQKKENFMVLILMPIASQKF